MRHFIAISEVDEKTRRLFKERPRQIIQYLHINGQEGKDFEVDDFVAKWNLLAFSFVRHPFDRSVGSAKFYFELKKIYIDFLFIGSFLHITIKYAIPGTRTRPCTRDS